MSDHKITWLQNDGNEWLRHLDTDAIYAVAVADDDDRTHLIAWAVSAGLNGWSAVATWGDNVPLYAVGPLPTLEEAKQCAKGLVEGWLARLNSKRR